MYIPLFIKTDYSLLSSLIKIDNLITYLKKNNITSCAITDDNLFSCMEVVTKCKKNGIKPIIGLEIKINDNSVLLYAKNENGYKNLIKIECLKNDDIPLTVDILKKHKEDLICIVFDPDIFIKLNKVYEDTYLGVNSKNQEAMYKNITDKLIFANRTLYLEKYEYKYLPYIFMIRDGKTISDGLEFKYQNNHLYTYDEVCNLVSIDTINNTIKVSEICNLEFTKNLYMPKYNVENSKEYLINLSRKGLAKRLNNNIPENYIKRLKYELDIIVNMHFEDYFLVVYDYIKFAKQNGILVGPGRGSAAGSLVSFCLGITEVDPIKYNLLFERFLNPERITMPDIDTDFPDIARDRVINYVKEKYGDENVAGIITFGTLGSKQAVRDVGRVLNINNKDIDYLCKNLSFKQTLKELKSQKKEISEFLESDDKLKMLYNLVCILENNKRHTSIHAAGIVISRENLKNVLPIIKSHDGMYLTEYTMEYLEEIGLIKMDFLGIKNLSTIDNIIKDIYQDTNTKIDFNKIPLDDSKVYEIFAKGDTIGIFQFESAGMIRFLKDLKPRNFDELSAAIALFRPGAAPNIPSFIKRKNKEEKVKYLDDSLKDILEETYGIIIYQEQIMLIAQRLANYTLAEADILRRAMSKKKYDVLKQEEDKFITRAIKNGYKEEKAKEIFDLILPFANYGFNKSHSISYSLVAYKMAYLKCYYPTYFYSNLLTGVVGSETKTEEYLREIKRLGIKFLPPDINKSGDTSYKVIDKKIIFPLATIRNVGGTSSSHIVNSRENGYSDIYDFFKKNYKRINNRKVFESLIYAHTFTSFGYNINTLISNLDTILNYIELSFDLDEDLLVKPEITIQEEYPLEVILEKEKELFGFYLTSHKTEKYKLNYKGITDIYELPNLQNKNVNIVISVSNKKEITTKKGDLMAFITGEDNSGSISVTFFPDIYKKYNTNKGDILLIQGKVEKRFDEYQLIAEKMKKLNEK